MTIIQGGVKITGFVKFTANYVPGTPTALTATWTTNVTNTVSLKFTPPAYQGSGAITSYTAVSNPAGFTATVVANTNTVIIPGLSSSTYYVFNMYATNFAGNSELSTASNVVYGIYSSPILLSSYSVPPAPTSISASITSTNLTSTPSALVKFLPGTSIIPATSYTILANDTMAGVGTSVPTTSYSGYFNGSSSWISFSTNPNPIVGTVDFTIEMWVYPLATTNGSMLGNWTQLNSPGDHGMKISFGRAVAGKFEFFYSSSGQSSPGVMVSANTYAANAWYHVAAVRVGSTVTLYVNGTSAVSGTYSNDMYEQNLWIGTENTGYNTTWFNGYISNLRIVRYLAVYTGNFTPPSGPLAVTQPAGANISALTVANTVTMLTLQNATSIVDNSSFARSLTVSGVTTSTAQPFDPYAYVTVSNLNPLTSYTFQAYATNLVGNGALSTTSSAITTYVTPGSSLYAFPGTYSWVAPAGVTSVSAVVVGAGGCGSSNGNTSSDGDDAYFISSSVLYANGGRGSSGGQGGTVTAGTGFPGGRRGTYSGIGSAGGGAGGYLGAGGFGASTTSSQAGSGGAGGGGGQNSTTGAFYGGGGVGLFGLGDDGAGGAISPSASGVGGGGGSGGLTSTGRCGGLFGGGGGPMSNGGYAGGGGALAYINNFSVVPGNSYTMFVPVGGVNSGAPGGARIIWPGQIRAYPSTAVTGCTGAPLLSSYVPKAPTIGTVTANSGTGITVRYTANLVNNAPAITSFTAVVTPGNITATVSTAGSYFIIVSGLTPLTTYSAYVYASNQYGNSAYSGSQSTTTAVASSSVAYTNPGTYTWVVPTNVTRVSVVAVGGGASGSSRCNNFANGGASSFTMVASPSTVHVSAGGATTTGGSVIAGSGNAGGAGGTAASNQQGGGGGAGGYSSSGSAGGAHGVNGGTSTNGGGGGGGGNSLSGGGGGGGVGLFGKSNIGTGGSFATSSPGTGGSCGVTGGYANFNLTGQGTGGFGGWFGGGGGGSYIPGNNSPGGGGGALAYANNISVVPGASYTVVVGAGGVVPDHAGGNGAVRIVWPGQLRSFPDTGVDYGYDSADTLSPSNTYVPGPPSIGSASASSSTGIVVNFTAPSSYYITPITSYTAVATSGATSITATTASAGTILILGLTPLTSYTVSMYATSIYGNSVVSNSLSTTTYVASASVAYAIPGTYSWVAPANVTAVSVVAVGGGGGGIITIDAIGGGGTAGTGGDSYFAATCIARAYGGTGASVGNGSCRSNTGGRSGTGIAGIVAFAGGNGHTSGTAGGAAGYAGAGAAAPGGTNSGAGGGGSGVVKGASYGAGGGVGLFGLGSDGAAGGTGTLCNQAGGGGSYGLQTPVSTYSRGGQFGGGGAAGYIGGYVPNGGPGGGLVYLNNYTVLPGISYTVVVGIGGSGTGSGSGTGGTGAVRIVWPGQVRRFPSTNVAQGYDTDTLTVNNTYVPSAPTVTTISANSATSISIGYTAPTYTGGSAIVSYTAVSSDGLYSATTATAGSGLIVVGGLTQLTSYSFSVYATNSYGNSVVSNSLSTTTYVASASVAYAIPGTYSWVAPANVTAVSVVAVGGGQSGRGLDSNNNVGSFSRFSMAALPNTVHVSANGGGESASIVGTGYAGGAAGGANCSNQSGGGGGAGGYNGQGGAGGSNAGNNPNDGAPSTGAGGGGGAGRSPGGGGGGGVGLFGLGSSGAAGLQAVFGGGGGGSGGTTGGYGAGSFANTGGFGGFFGGGGGGSFISGGAMPGGAGGALAYANNISVTPGATYTVVAGAGGINTNMAGGNGAVRIVWPGQVRRFPSTNVDQGYDSDTLTLNNTYISRAPTISSAFASSGTAITVNVVAPSSYYITPITSYIAVATTGTTSITRSAASAGSILILGLTPLTRYTVSVYATSTYGSSTASLTQQVVTLVASGEDVYTTPGTYSWTAPANVTSVSVVAVGGGGSGKTGGVGGTSTAGADSYFYNSLVVYANGGAGGLQGASAGGTVGAGTGGTGGAGGTAGAQNNTGGGGGAGGYSGAGGRGGNNSGAGVAGSGGAGGGGASSQGSAATSGAGGGGVGIYGIGGDGVGGILNCSTGLGTGGGGGSGGCNGGNHGALGDYVPGSGGLYGGGGGGFKGGANCGGDGGGGAGGALAYANNISVTPGATYTVVAGAGGIRIYSGASSSLGTPGQGGNGAVRIIWPGTVRTFPSTLTGPSSNL